MPNLTLLRSCGVCVCNLSLTNRVKMLLEIRRVWNEQGPPPSCLKVSFVCCWQRVKVSMQPTRIEPECVRWRPKHCSINRYVFMHQRISVEAYEFGDLVLKYSFWDFNIDRNNKPRAFFFPFTVADLLHVSFHLSRSDWKMSAKGLKCKCETQVLSFLAGRLQAGSSRTHGSQIMLLYLKMDMHIKIQRNAKFLLRLSSLGLK